MFHRLKKRPVKLSKDERAAFEKGLLSEKTGRFYTMEESLQLIRKNRQEWLKAQEIAKA